MLTQKKWVEDELIDYIAPQIYFSFKNQYAPYAEVASWWSNVCKVRNVHLYIGQALYKVNDNKDSNFNGEKGTEELSNQLKFNIEKPGISGSIMFRTQNFYDKNKQEIINVMRNEIWQNKVLIPSMPWKDNAAPEAPARGKLEQLDGSLRLTWDDDQMDTAYYAVYKLEIGEETMSDIKQDFRRIIATVRNDGKTRYEYIDDQTKDNAVYAVTALDRLHNESKPLILHRIKLIE